MRARHPHGLPTCWLMTDERLGEALWPAIDRLPRGSGIIVRHYALPDAERRALFKRIERRARAKHHIVIRAGSDRLGAHEAGVHGRQAARVGGIKTWPAHNRAEVVAGMRAGAEIIFVSPVFATRSHPGGAVLGPLRAALMIRHAPRSGARFIALGGMTEQRFGRMKHLGFAGWGAVDALANHHARSHPAARALRPHGSAQAA